MQLVFKGNVQRPQENIESNFPKPILREGKIIFISGVLVLLMVPVFKTVTHLPPFMGILIGLGILWVLTEILHGDKDEAERANFSVAYALRKIDTPSIFPRYTACRCSTGVYRPIKTGSKLDGLNFKRSESYCYFNRIPVSHCR
jgi:hypothetical protein